MRVETQDEKVGKTRGQGPGARNERHVVEIGSTSAGTSETQLQASGMHKKHGLRKYEAPSLSVKFEVMLVAALRTTADVHKLAQVLERMHS